MKNSLVSIPKKAVLPLIHYLEEENKIINYIDPCSGDGSLIWQLSHSDYIRNVYSSDIDPKYHKSKKHSVIDLESKIWPSISSFWEADMFISNPPWKNDEENDFELTKIIQSISKVRPTWLFLPGSFVYNENEWKNFGGDIGVLHYCQSIIPVGRFNTTTGKPDKSLKYRTCAWYCFDRKNVVGAPKVLPRVSLD